MDKTVPLGRVKGTLTPPCSKSYAQRALAASLLCGETSVLRNLEFCDDTRSALRCIETLGARVKHVDASTLSIEGGLHPRGKVLHVGESGLATAFHPHRIALRDARHHRRPGHPATAPHAHDDRTAAPPRRPGTGQRRLPALRSVRPDPGRGNRRRRFRFVAVHHGAAAGAPCLAARHHAPRPQRRLDPLSGHDRRHGGTLRRGDLP